MCGVAAYAAFGRDGRGREAIEAALAKLHHRGPDGRGVLDVPDQDHSVVLGHTRLAIVGGSGAAQPLRWSRGDSRFYLVHNGEIYNYKELRSDLIREGRCRGDEFRTRGDSEVLLACLARRGVDGTLRRLRGMFAFVFVESRVVDGRERVRKVVLCR